MDTITTIVDAVVGLGTEITKLVIGIKGQQRVAIQDFMNEYVAHGNATLQGAIAMNPSLYNQNKQKFVAEYLKAASRRETDIIKAEKQQPQINTILIVAVIALVIYYIATKKQ